MAGIEDKKIENMEIENNKKFIEQYLYSIGFLEKGDKYKINHVTGNIYSIGNKNLWLYLKLIDGKVEKVLSLKNLIEDKYFKEALVLSGLYFTKEKDSPTDHLHILKYNGQDVYNLDAKTLLKLVEQVQDSKDKKERLKGLEKGKEIDKFSYEYFKAWKNIAFYEDRLILKAIQKTILLWSLKKELDKHNIKGFFDRTRKEKPNYFLDFKLEEGTLLIKDIEFFANYQMLSKDKNKNEELKKYYIKKIVKDWFLKQIMDERFIKTADQITKEQVEEYYKKGYLSEKIYKQAKKTLEEIEKADTKLDKKKEEEQKKEISPHAKELREFFKSVGVDID